MDFSSKNRIIPKTTDLEEAGIFNLVTIKTRTAKELMGNNKKIGYKELIESMKRLGCDDNILEQLKELTKKHDLFTIHTSIIEGTDILSIVIKCSIQSGVKLILLQKTEYYSIDIETGERKKKYGFTIV